jgi:hypothetical protein
MLTLQEVSTHKHQNIRTGYQGATKYMGLDVAPWNHPSAIANYLLQLVKHTIVQGVQVVAPQGYGKTTLATVICHHIHTKRPEFVIKWAGPYEFTHQDDFFGNLEKHVPHVILFDDITGALNQMTDKQIQQNLSSLVQVRKYLDPETKKTPAIIFTISHYSLNVEKSVRAQLQTKIFADFGAEEKSNIDRLARKGTPTYNTLNSFGKIVEEMYTNDKFSLRLGNGVYIEYKTGDPFRCACAITDYNANMLLFAEKDVCETCSQKKVAKYIEPEMLFEKVKNAYGSNGIQALRHTLVKRGHLNAVSNQTATAIAYLEEKLFPNFTTDLAALVQLIYKDGHRRPPTRGYRKHKLEDDLDHEMITNSVEKPIETLEMMQAKKLEESIIAEPKQLTDSNTVQS